MTLGSSNISERSLAIDERVGWIVTLIGIPSAFLLHGYVGFIFGSIKANPWWSSPLMPVVFIFSAMVSGIAGVMLLYMAITKLRKQKIDMHCVDTIAMYLFYIFIIDFSLEMLDLIHRIYEADESFRSLNFMVHTQLYIPHIVIQICLGTLTPLILLGMTQVVKLPEIVRKRIYVRRRLPDADRHLCHALECGDRRAVVLQELSRLHHLQDEPGDAEGLLVAIFLTLLPLVFLWVLVKLLPPWPEKSAARCRRRLRRTRSSARNRVETMDDLPDALDRLTHAPGNTGAARRMPLNIRPKRPACPFRQPPSTASAAGQPRSVPLPRPAALFSVLGKAMLGIAGAYLLRAVAESSVAAQVGGRRRRHSSTPPLAGIGASRVKAGEWLAATIYACTSALILAPMLWELTLRFKVLPPR